MSKPCHHAQFAAEVVSNIRDEAEYGSLMIVDFEGEKDPEASTRRRTRALFQIWRLLMAVEVFEQHISKFAAGSFKLRRAALHMDKAIADAKGFMTSDVEEKLRKGNIDESGQAWGGAAHLQVSAQRFMGEVGMNSFFISGDKLEERRKDLDQEAWYAGID